MGRYWNMWWWYWNWIFTFFGYTLNTEDLSYLWYMVKETQSVSWSLSILAFTLIFIYIIFFSVKGESLKAEIASVVHTWTAITGAVSSESIWDKWWTKVVSGWAQGITTWEKVIWDTSWWKIPDKILFQNKTFFSVQSLFWTHEVSSELEEKNILLLRKDLWQWRPGVSVAEAGLKSLESVWIQDFWKYILKDIDNTHYVYLGKQDKNILRTRIEQMISPKWWNILEISDKNRIKQDQLIGDEVWKIVTSYSQEKNKVLLIIFWEGDGDTWFLQIDQDILDKKMWELREMFAKRY